LHDRLRERLLRLRHRLLRPQPPLLHLDTPLLHTSYRPEGISTAGIPSGELLEKTLDAGGNSVYEVYMPPASAALMIVR
jgi:hypothetical protein